VNSNQLNIPWSHENGPWTTPWPSDELEHLAACPVCGNSERTLIHKDLIDNVFYCAPGKWNSWRCSDCQCAYLDPRPSSASIHLAYENYYTHQDVQPEISYAELSQFRKLGQFFINGYINRRYAANKTPAAKLIGPLVCNIFHPVKTIIDREYRQLPRLPVNGGNLLDVGCGNGDFLQKAKFCGWNVFGIDPDPEATSIGLKLGLNVGQGGIERFDGEQNLFDVITLSHVIEHVHDPVAVLKACCRLLKPGGQLYLETPNVDSFGHFDYKKNWRGLEPPRHLFLFNSNSLILALATAGFTTIKNISKINPIFHINMTKAGEDIKNGRRIDAGSRLSAMGKWKVIKNCMLELLFQRRNEFLTVVASKDKF